MQGGSLPLEQMNIAVSIDNEVKVPEKEIYITRITQNHKKTHGT